MEAISKEKAIQKLFAKKISLFDINDAQKIFAIKNANSLYKFLQRLEKAAVIKRIAKGKYHFSFIKVNDFELANFLVSPSYISLESALSFYGILSQFPYTLTSITPLKSKRIIYQEKEYEFSHLTSKFFFGFEKRGKFLVATPEKALLDELYFVAKKLRKIDFEDLDLSQINKKKLKKMCRDYQYSPLQNLIKELKLF